MNLSVVLMLAIAVKAVIGYLTNPIKQFLETPKADRNGVFVLSLITPYLSFVAGGVVGWFAKVDTFAAFLPDAPQWLSLGLTAALIGGGASLVYDIVKALKEWSEKVGALTPTAPVPPVIGDVWPRD